MPEQNVPLPTSVQLHLRVHPELVELIDAYRGPATRNAYAGMILEWEIKRRHNTGHEAMTAIADRALMDPDSIRTGWEIPSGVPLEHAQEAIRRGPQPCPHPKARVIKGLCGACGTNVG